MSKVGKEVSEDQVACELSMKQVDSDPGLPI
jgi:hypothetical protein